MVTEKLQTISGSMGMSLTTDQIGAHCKCFRIFIMSKVFYKNMTDQQEQLMIKEQWLREELKHTRTIWFGLLQWGITVLSALESSLYFVRRDVTEHLIKAGALKADDLMPWPRWFIGTAFLTFIAYVFCLLTIYIGKKHVLYREQLVAMKPSYSGIDEHPTGTKLRLSPYWLFFAFPFIDAVLYLGFSIARSFNIPW